MKTRWFMDIEDKIYFEDERTCPPHKMPHTLPFIGEAIADEGCHYHEKWWRMLHHTTFCEKMKCPYVERMIEDSRERRN